MDTTLDPGHKIELFVQLFPPAMVTGTVLDENGQALQGVEVLTYVYLYNDAGTRLRSNVAGATAKTNDLGDFRIENLDVGDYFFEIRPTPLAMSGNRLSSGPVFYPGVTDRFKAERVHLESGHNQLRTVTSRQVRAGVLRVKLSNQTGDEPRGAMVLRVFRQGEDSAPLASMMVQKDILTQFVEIGRFPPDRYLIRATFVGANGIREGVATVEIGESGAELNLPIVRLEPWTVTGRVVIETADGETIPVPGVQFAFYDAASTVGYAPRSQAPITLTSQLDGLFPRTVFSIFSPPYLYHTQVVNPPIGTYVASVLGGNSTREFRPDHGRQTDLTIVLKTDVGAIEGTATSSKGLGVPYARVVLVPDDPNEMHRLVATSTAANGSFHVQVGPGNYHLYASRDHFGAPYLNPGFKQEYEAESIPLQIVPGRRLTLNPVIDD